MTVLNTRLSVRLRTYNADKTKSRLFPVSAFNITMAENEVPYATVRIPLGKSMRTGLMSVTGAIRDEMLKTYNLCQILAIIEGDFTTEDRWNDKATLIFEGKLDAVADAMTRDQASLQVSMTHWMQDLQASPLLVSYAHPADPRNMTTLAATYGVTGAEVGGAFDGRQTFTIGQLADVKWTTPDDPAADIWSDTIKSLYGKLLVNPLRTVQSDFGCFTTDNRPPEKTQRAFQRIEGASQELGSPYSKWAVPLRISSEERPLDTSVIEAILRALTDEPMNAYQANTVWDMLVGRLVGFLDCMVIPRVSSAIVAPYLPDLKNIFCHRLKRADVYQVAAVQPVRRPLKGVITMAAMSDAYAQAAPFGDAANPFNTSLACFIPASAETKEARTLFAQPPRYIGMLDANQAQAQFATYRGTTGNMSDLDPTEPIPAAAAEALRRELKRNLLLAHAKSLYHREHRRGSNLRVVGKLRFDISPGTQLGVSMNADQYSEGNDAFHLVQGHVKRVNINFDAHAKTGATIFELDHVRPINEVEQEASLENHPLFLDNFLGATLTDDYENTECR